MIQPDEGVTPAALMLVTMTLRKEAGIPASVIAPEPPKTTLPVLEKPLPRFKVTADEGMKFKMPLLVIVPLFVTSPRKLWVERPPLNDAPLPIVIPYSTVHPTGGLIPLVLLIVMKPN